VPDDPLQRRIDFSLNLLCALKNIQNQLAHELLEIEKTSGSVYEKIFDEDRGNIQDQVDKYKANIEKNVALNYEIMNQINLWYDFVKNPRKMKGLFFPVQFYFYQRKLKKRIRKINREIGSMTIENRFIMEKLTNWEQGLEQKALLQIKEGDYYQGYLRLETRKNELVSDLEYVLSTLPLPYPVQLDFKDIDGFMTQLRGISSL